MSRSLAVAARYLSLVGYLSAAAKALNATDGAGKAIAADKLAELLKETTPVVLVSGPILPKHRKLFKDTTVFVEVLPPEPK